MAGSSASSSTVSKSDEEREDMLDRMLTSLALCDDSKLENLLSKLLPLAISCLSTSSTAVRNKVLEILSHVNKRVKHEPGIGLPLSALWDLYTEATASTMVHNFCIIYIEMAFERLQIEDKKNRAPNLLVNISKLPPRHQEIVLRIAARVIGESHPQKIDDNIVEKYRLMRGTEDCEIFVDFCLHTLLYQPSSQSGGCPPGLSMSQAHRVTGKQPLTNEIIVNRKVKVIYST